MPPGEKYHPMQRYFTFPHFHLSEILASQVFTALVALRCLQRDLKKHYPAFLVVPSGNIGLPQACFLSPERKSLGMFSKAVDRVC